MSAHMISGCIRVRPLVDEDVFDLAKAFLAADFFNDRGRVIRISDKHREELTWRLAGVVQRAVEDELQAISNELNRTKKKARGGTP